MIFRSFDLETTGVDVETAEVVQAAIVDAPALAHAVGDKDVPCPSKRRTAHSVLFAARDVPIESTRVHRITDRDPDRFDFPVTLIPDDAPAFAACVQSMVTSLTEPDVVAVSFNGCGYDIPIIARYAAMCELLHDGQDLEGHDAPTLAQWQMVRRDIEAALRARHVDVMRLWARARVLAVEAPWLTECVGTDEHGVSHFRPELTSDMFTGGLTSAHGFWLGRGFASAHDASVDCHATLDVLRAMLASGFVDLDTAIKWSNEPLPGDVDFDGKFKWQGDQAVISFGKHDGTPLKHVPTTYLRWMLGDNFPASTKQLIRLYLNGQYPERDYE